MAGHMGDDRVTVKNLRVFESNVARGVLLIEGAVPGADERPGAHRQDGQEEVSRR